MILTTVDELRKDLDRCPGDYLVLLDDKPLVSTEVFEDFKVLNMQAFDQEQVDEAKAAGKLNQLVELDKFYEKLNEPRSFAQKGGENGKS